MRVARGSLSAAQAVGQKVSERLHANRMRRGALLERRQRRAWEIELQSLRAGDRECDNGGTKCFNAGDITDARPWDEEWCVFGEGGADVDAVWCDGESEWFGASECDVNAAVDEAIGSESRRRLRGGFWGKLPREVVPAGKISLGPAEGDAAYGQDKKEKHHDPHNFFCAPQLVRHVPCNTLPLGDCEVRQWRGSE